jgi:hypothetical protein
VKTSELAQVILDLLPRHIYVCEVLKQVKQLKSKPNWSDLSPQEAYILELLWAYRTRHKSPGYTAPYAVNNRLSFFDSTQERAAALTCVVNYLKEQENGALERKDV